MPSKLKWQLMADGQPVRLGTGWLRSMPCPHYRRLDQFIGGPGTLALALSHGGTLFFVDLSEWRPGFSNTGIDAESFGPPFRPGRRLVNRKAFRAAVKQAHQEWKERLADFGANFPPLYRSLPQRIADRCFGPRLSIGQVVLASEREIVWPLYGHPSKITAARWCRETAIVATVPNLIEPWSKGIEILAHSIIDAEYAARKGARAFINRVWFHDWKTSGDDSDYVEGFSLSPAQSDEPSTIVSIHHLMPGHESLSYAPPIIKKGQKPGQWEFTNRDAKRLQLGIKTT